MSIQLRLTVMNFMQFFVWGAWLISLGAYMIVTLGFTGGQVGSIYATMGVASLFMPGLMGIVADRWVNAERLYGVLHLIGAGLLLWASTVRDFDTLYVIMLLNAMVYMPTIALNNAVSYKVLEQRGPQRHPKLSADPCLGHGRVHRGDVDGGLRRLDQERAAALHQRGRRAVPRHLRRSRCRSARRRAGGQASLVSALGLDAFVLFRRPQMLVFFMFAMMLGAALQITNAFGGAFLADFTTAYPDSFGVQHPNLLLSISQISETLFILTIPFFLQRFGIKIVMLISIFAWVFRFGLFAVGDPGAGLWMLVLSMIIYGMAFDFFNISGSLFVDRESEANDPRERAGPVHDHDERPRRLRRQHGGGRVVDHFTVDGVKDWQSIWFTFAGYALVLGLVFPFVFKYRHERSVAQ